MKIYLEYGYNYAFGCEVDYSDKTCEFDSFYPSPVTVFVRGTAYRRTGRTFAGLRVYRA